MPLTFMDGAEVMAWNRLVWLLSFGLVTWLFFHVLINPGGAYLEPLGDKKVQLMLATLAGYSAVTLGTWWLFRRRAGGPIA